MARRDGPPVPGATDSPRGEHPRPRKVTRAYLERAAMAYLERFSSSAENLRRVLTRKVERRCRLRGEDPAAFVADIDAVVRTAIASGLVDDRRYAEGRAATLRRRGGSARLIAARLSAKGIDRELVAEVVGGDAEDAAAAERAAALALARRRRLGPFRTGERRAHREKDLAALVRAGFRFDLARSVVDSEEEN